MKRLLFPLALALASTTVSAATETGRIDFTGYIYAGGTCPIELVEPGMGLLPSVSMGNFLPKHFPAVGTTSPEKAFALRITPTPTCTPSATAKVTFEALHGKVGGDALYGLRRGVGTASGLGVLIKDQNHNILKPDMESEEYDISPTKPTDMQFYAAYQSTDPIVTEGLAEARVNFSVELP
ncbi:type 1 fimbrial protein [Pseudomonas asiatica]|uniref:fimbrial protein n=1 Tax=Pseudomonas asiatica TaxID=2219225 RepID=UPI002DB64623|nr:fimbrial protein [Pseudomonas asiatica]MEB6590863.1 type 1 fimbrial protein [Pseudomonas asiatica]